jgi:hypothetical protein
MMLSLVIPCGWNEGEVDTVASVKARYFEGLSGLSEE